MAESRSSPDVDSPRCEENLKEILQEVHHDWMPLFDEFDSKKQTLLDLFSTSIRNVEEYLRKDKKPMIPEKRKLLLPLSRCPPQDVKVVILGHDPLSDPSLATGFAFSVREGMFSDEKFKVEKAKAQRRSEAQRRSGARGGRGDYVKMESLAVLHKVLVKAGYLERGADYDGCHEVWADRGVLLLNAALTYNLEEGESKNEPRKNKHFPYWLDFVSRLLFLVAQYSQQKPVFFLCWGDNAKDVSTQLLLELEKRHHVQKIDDIQHNTEVDRSAYLVVFIGHHPTWPKKEKGNKFKLQATNQFKAIQKRYPDLFMLLKTKDQSPEKQQSPEEPQSTQEQQSTEELMVNKFDKMKL